MTTIDNLKSRPISAGSFVGDLVSPTMTTRSGISRQAAAAAFEGEGVHADFSPSVRGLFGLAFNDARQKQYVGALHESLSWEREAARSEAVLLRWSYGKGKSKETKTLARATMRPPFGQLDENHDPTALEYSAFYGAASDEIRDLTKRALTQFRERWRWHFENVATHEVRRLIETKLHEANAVRISASLFYVPASGHSLAVALERAVELSASGDIAVFPQFDSAMGIARTGRMVRAALLDEVADVRKQLAELRANESDTRESTIATRITRLREIRERAVGCAAVLGRLADDVNAEVASTLASILGGAEQDDGDLAAE